MNTSKVKKYKQSYNNGIQKINDGLFRTLFNKANNAIAFIEINKNGINSRFIEANNKMINKLGYTKNELLNMSIFDVTVKEEIDNIQKIMRHLLEDKQITYETTIVSKTGTKIYTEISGHIIELDGKNVGMFIGRDITYKKNAERALFECAERYRKLVELLPDAIHIKYKTKYIYSNEAGARLLGFKAPEELIGKNDLDFTHPDYRKISRERGDRIRSGEEKLPLRESKIIRNDGKIIDVEVASISFNYNGEKAILSVVRDITERKKAEEAIKKMMTQNKELLNIAVENEKLKTEFFSNISHEFRTPLNVILGAVQLLNKNMAANNIDKQLSNKYIRIMKQNCYRLLRLVNNLIDITKIDSGYLELDFKNYNIINIIEDITLSVAEYAQNKGMAIIFDTEVEEKIVACDADKIERIMLNLLSNSIKYNKDNGEIFVNIYDKIEYLIVSIKDTGIGISEDKIGVIFERFRQVDTSLHRINEGSGVGLSLVKSLVEKHGGEIWVESKYGEGTEFFIKLPVKVLPEKNSEFDYTDFEDSLVERVSIEFSDIYKLQ
jgi:PAS domain S-box-containing protein